MRSLRRRSRVRSDLHIEPCLAGEWMAQGGDMLFQALSLGKVDKKDLFSFPERLLGGVKRGLWSNYSPSTIIRFLIVLAICSTRIPTMTTLDTGSWSEPTNSTTRPVRLDLMAKRRSSVMTMELNGIFVPGEFSAKPTAWYTFWTEVGHLADNSTRSIIECASIICLSIAKLFDLL